MDFATLIAQLRSQLPADSPALSTLDTLSTGLQPYQNLDVAAARTALETVAKGESAQLQTQLTGLTETNTQLLANNRLLQAQLLSSQTLSKAGVLPGYEDLIYGQASQAVVFGEDGKPSLPDNFISDYKTKYPAMFAAVDAAGTGTAGNGSSNSTGATQPQTITPVNNIISGVDPKAIMTGAVTLASA
jgi:hypothetical protein